jgi:hypothetical protein
MMSRGAYFFGETCGVAGLWECGLHLLVLNERSDKVAGNYAAVIRRCSRKKTQTQLHRSISIRCDDVLENLRKATPCFIAADVNLSRSRSDTGNSEHGGRHGTLRDGPYRPG